MKNTLQTSLKNPFWRLPSAHNALPESPCWHQRSLFWVDHGSQVLHRFDWVKQHYSSASLAVAGNLRFVKSCPDGALLIGSESGLYRLDQAGKWVSVAGDLPLTAKTCINDGAVGPSGELIIATSDRAEAKPLGGFYRYKKGQWMPVLTEITVANGPAFSTNGRIFYSNTLDGEILSGQARSQEA